MEKAGDFINDKLWHRIVQVVTNARELHEPAARSALAKLRAGMCHEMLVKAGAYFLGEFGHTLGGAMGEGLYRSPAHTRAQRVKQVPPRDAGQS